ncbi:MAG: hypothetical protein AB7V56_16680 [Candidatus Nitrosocosmicus sp.]
MFKEQNSSYSGSDKATMQSKSGFINTIHKDCYQVEKKISEFIIDKTY